MRRSETRTADDACVYCGGRCGHHEDCPVLIPVDPDECYHDGWHDAIKAVCRYLEGVPQHALARDVRERFTSRDADPFSICEYEDCDAEPTAGSMCIHHARGGT